MMMKTIFRIGLGSFLCFTGIAHFAITDSFLAQVPKFMPAPEMVIYVSGVFEVLLGISLIAVRRFRRQVGWIAAAFFVIIFPGNISQYLTHSAAFGLDTDNARALRLLFQPVLIAVALWSTDALRKS